MGLVAKNLDELFVFAWVYPEIDFLHSIPDKFVGLIPHSIEKCPIDIHVSSILEMGDDNGIGACLEDGALVQFADLKSSLRHSQSLFGHLAVVDVLHECDQAERASSMIELNAMR